jgi:hypothetical protein
MTDDPKKSWHDSLPFPKHWLAYVMLKIAVVVFALFLLYHFTGAV